MEKLANGIYVMHFGTEEVFTPYQVLKPKSRWEQLNRLSDGALPFDEKAVRSRGRSSGFLLELPLEQGEEVYGLGLTLKSFRQTGLKKMLRANSDPVADNGDSHAPVPFYVTSRGYGVLVDTCRHVTFHAGNVKMRGSRQDLENFPSAGTNVGHWWVKEGSGNMFIDVAGAQGVAIYIFCGESMLDVVARYNLFSGGGALVPRWGLGVMYRGYMPGDGAHMLRLARQLREQHMPCDIFGLEPGWQTHAYSCTYAWDPERYPDPAAFLQEMRDMGYHINLWEHAYVHPDSPIFEQMKPYAGDNYVWNGLVPDFTTQGARDVFQQQHDPLIAQGVDGFKLDECDSSDFTANWGFPDFTEFPGGMDGEQMHAIFGNLYQQTVHEMYQRRNQRTYGEVRQTGAFSAPMPYVLYSDLYDHTDFIRGMAGAAFSGILWTPEVRQAESAEELLRRIAAAVVSPQTVLNGYMVPMTPWMQYDLEKNYAGELLENHQELTDMCRRLLEMRMRLIPHLYTAFMNYYENGVPPVRPLVMDFPDETEVKDIYDQFMLGDGLMATPMIAGQGDSRRVYFPRGIWYEMKTGRKISGGCWETITPALDEVPLFVREGTLLVLAQPKEHLVDGEDFVLDVMAYGAQSSVCRLACDDGLSTSLPVEEIPWMTLRAEGEQLKVENENPLYKINSFRRVR